MGRVAAERVYFRYQAVVQQYRNGGRSVSPEEGEGLIGAGGVAIIGGKHADSRRHSLPTSPSGGGIAG